MLGQLVGPNALLLKITHVCHHLLWINKYGLEPLTVLFFLVEDFNDIKDLLRYFEAKAVRLMLRSLSVVKRLRTLHGQEVLEVDLAEFLAEHQNFLNKQKLERILGVGHLLFEFAFQVDLLQVPIQQAAHHFKLVAVCLSYVHALVNQQNLNLQGFYLPIQS